MCLSFGSCRYCPHEYHLPPLHYHHQTLILLSPPRQLHPLAEPPLCNEPSPAEVATEIMNFQMHRQELPGFQIGRNDLDNVVALHRGKCVHTHCGTNGPLPCFALRQSC